MALNRLPARATLVPFASDTARLQGDSVWRKVLDGTWRFQLVDGPDDAPADWTRQALRDPDWRDIQVPGVWTRQETGDLPHYANWRMPFDCQKPPHVPAQNPTGLYRMDLEVPADWHERRSILHIGGFESLVLVWCNGVFIGMGKDSRLPSEFDLSAAIQVGSNQLAIMVVRWCDATWIEDQDHWNHGGLHRSVWLESRASTHVQDLIVATDFDAATGTGTASLRVEVDGPSAGYQVEARLEDAHGHICATLPSVPVEQFDMSASTGQQMQQSYTFDGYAAKLALSLPQAEAWSAEQPTRYRLITKLTDPQGTCVEMHETWIGFTRIETSERRLRVNGQPIVLIGVNRHDHHPENGKTCSRADIRAELVTMKRHNINAIRTAHYPNDPILLDLADELGFYVIDEANVESHARWTEVAQHPGFLAAMVDRTVRMIARDRNHPCIIGWSLGNEAGHGPAHDAAAAAARHLDPTRFVHYEGAVSQRLSFGFGRSPETTQIAPMASERAATDVVCPMYTPMDHMVDWARWAEATGEDDRPFLLCEFSHAMGNSNGSVAAYVEAFFAEPALAGGFVWDWRDQGLAETDADGRFYWAYGGHYGDQPNDKNFNINGLVGPDGLPHPALREYMWAARPVIVRHKGGRAIELENRRVFADTSDLELTWYLQCDGRVVERGEVETVLAPGQKMDVALSLSTPLDPNHEWHLSVGAQLRQANLWAPAGLKLAWDQFELSARPAFTALPSAESPAGLTVAQAEDGTVRNISLAGAAVIDSAITPCLWRAPTDNDGGKPGSRPLYLNKTAEWVSYGLHDLKPGPAEPDQAGAGQGVIASHVRAWSGEAGKALQHHSTWRAIASGLLIEETLIVPEAWQDVPRIGIRFEVPKRFSQLEWFGLGPDESYPDRCAAQTVGRWQSSVPEQYHPYVRPQEYGAHEQCRWFRLTDASGQGIDISLPEPMSFTARPHHDVDLNAAETLAELSPGETTEVHIDIGLRGLGTAACGPDVLSDYVLRPGTYSFSWVLRAVRPAD